MGMGFGTMEILQVLQTVSVLLAIFVAMGTLKNRDSDKTAELTEMRVDIKYIKGRIDGIEGQRDEVVELRSAVQSANKRLDDHIKYDHNKATGERKE